MTFEQLEQYLQQGMPYIIYGAGVIANEVYVAIRILYGRMPSCFLITEKCNSCQVPKEIPVICLEDLDVNHLLPLILVATPEIYHNQILCYLSGYKIENICCVESHMEYCLMKRYFRIIKRFPLLEDIKQEKKLPCCDIASQFSVYMARSENDIPLKMNHELPMWIIPVWAGNECVGKSVKEENLLSGSVPSDIMEVDNAGKNISIKNRNYCELTVAYWAWKNRSNVYMGICHYRRMLLLKESDLEACIAENVDVILPLPFVCYPNASGQYLRYINRKDRKNLEQVLLEISPEYIPVLHRVDQEPYFYNYNMLIAKKEIFNDYCGWIFSVLERAEKYCEPVQGIRNDRYAGYLGELLTTLYFIKNERSFRIMHGEKKWMV